VGSPFCGDACHADTSTTGVTLTCKHFHFARRFPLCQRMDSATSFTNPRGRKCGSAPGHRLANSARHQGRSTPTIRFSLLVLPPCPALPGPRPSDNFIYSQPSVSLIHSTRIFDAKCYTPP
jgi:hypothetical protein